MTKHHPYPTPTPTPSVTPTPTPEPSQPTTIGTPVFPETHTSTHVPVVHELAETGATDMTLPLAGLGLGIILAGVLVGDIVKRVRGGGRA